MQTFGHFIDGAYVEPVGRRWLDSSNPYTGEVWARIPQGCRQDVDRAVAAASRALRHGPWATMTATARGKLLTRLADLVAANADRLAATEVRDNGKGSVKNLGQPTCLPWTDQPG